MPDLKIEIGFGVEGRDDFCYFDDSFLVIEGLEEKEIADCLEAENTSNSDLIPVTVWGQILNFVKSFQPQLKENFPEHDWNKDYTYSFEVLDQA